MDYVVGSIAALISGNVTPNRPKLIRRALTPTKHPVSPDVTPKSEAVEDRSIFLSPSVQKKKDIVKKSPKRIFENPDLDVTDASEITSPGPKADKVKKHLVEDLESSIMDKSSILDKKSSGKLDKSIDTASPNKKSKINHSKVSNENTPKKNKRNSHSAKQNEELNISLDISKDGKSPKITLKQAEAAKTNPTPKKNKKKIKSELNNSKLEVMDIAQTTQVKSPKKKLILETIGFKNKENQDDATQASKASLNVTNSNEQCNKKKNKKRKKKAKKTIQEESGNKSENAIKKNTTDIDQTTQVKSPKQKFILETIGVQNKDDTTQASKTSLNGTNSNEQCSKKKNKKRKKKAKKTNQEESGNKSENSINQNTTDMTATSEVASETKNQKKKKNRNNKNKKVNPEIKPPKQEELEGTEVEFEDDEDTTMEVNRQFKEVESNESDSESDDDEEKTKVVKGPEKMITQEVHGYESSDNESDDDESEEEVSNIANPNAITEKDSDSEHDSDNEIESDIETSNADALQTDKADESSDDEEEVVPKKGKTKKAEELVTEEKNKGMKEVNTEDEIKRTLFVGNVLFSSKCKKEIKKIFAQYGEIETVRIRTVPVKDARVTPKLAVIRNEIHPDRSTVNVYIKFADPDSVERALSENNRVLNEHHLRVTRSGATGVEHDPACAVFVGNLPFGIEDETLRSKFQGCGEVHSVRIVRDKKTNAGKGFGYVNFATKDAVELALELSEEDLTVKNRIMRVKRCTMTLSKGFKKGNQSVKPQRKENHNRNFGNNQGQNRNFGNNQGQNRNLGNNRGQNRNFGSNGPNRGGRNNQGPSRNFGNQGERSFGNNQGQNRNFGNNRGRNFENQGRSFEKQGRSFGNQGSEASGAARRLMNKRPHQGSGDGDGDGPSNKRQNASQSPRDKKQRNEFVGITAEKKKKQKFDKGQKKKKALSEILTKKRE